MHGRPIHSSDDVSHASHPHRWRVLFVLVLALLVTSIDHTIINVALPRLVNELGTDSAGLQWVVAAYTVVFAGLLLTAGSLGDRFGRRHALVAGIGTFMAGSVGAAMSTSTAMLVASRGVMGVGGALIMPTTLSILVNVFGNPRERAKAIAIWTAASGLGIALGPIAGGALMRSFSWSSVFWINVPLLAVALVGALHVVPDSRDPRATRLDPVGAVLSIVAISSLVYAVIDAPERGWTSARPVAALTGGLVAGAAFLVWELRRHDPMLDIRLFRNRGFSAGSMTLTALFFAMAGAIFLQAQYLQFILGYTPLAAGFALVPAALGVLVGSGAGAHLSAVMGGRSAVIVGTVLAAAGTAVQAAWIDGTSYLPTGIGLALFGLGAGIAMPTATDLIMATLPPSRAGVGSAVNDTVREIGGALGVAVIGSIAAGAYAADLNERLDQVGGVPSAMREAATDNVGAALEVGRQLGAEGAALAAAARDSFVGAMSSALWVSALCAAVAAVTAFVYLPRRTSRDEAPVATPAPEGAARSASHLHAVGRSGHLVAVAIVAAALVALVSCGSDAREAASVPESTLPESTLPGSSVPGSSVPGSAPVDRPTAEVDRLVAIDGGRMHLRCVGSGDETVVLVAGWDGGEGSWEAIVPAVSERTRVCSYAKFGTGGSDPAPVTQTFATQAADLHELLDAAGEPGPYVVVGHSFGGALGVTLAATHPEEVAGLLLVDASPPTWPATVCSVPAYAPACELMRDPARDAERLDVVGAFDEVARISSLGTLPMTVMTGAHRDPAGLTADEVARLDTEWAAGQRQWASLTPSTRVVTVEQTGHHIEVDQPGRVLDELFGLIP